MNSDNNNAINAPTLQVLTLPHAEGLSLPSYATDGAAGLDLVAANTEPIVLQSLERVAVPTGLCIAIPPGFEGQVRARSGRARKEGLAVLNAPGTIDEDYRGELAILLVNLSREAITILRGERIAQLVIAPVQRVRVQSVSSLQSTDRGTGGFGSTGR
jgi:dUTP pyrophosphatase